MEDYPVSDDIIYIYALHCPDIGLVNEGIRYIGKTFDPKLRLIHHCLPSKLKGRNFKNCWIKGLMNKGMRPLMSILAKVPANEWEMHEINWIAYGRQQGWGLLNYTMGGDGAKPLPGVSMPEEQRKRIGDAHRGRKHTTESSKVFSAGQKRRFANMTFEEKEAWKAQRGKPCPADERERKSKWNIGRKIGGSSKYIGVHISSNGQKWISETSRRKIRIYIGSFDSEEDAAKAYDKFALKHDGPCAKLNFPEKFELQ